jgi:hypothetical protein
VFPDGTTVRASASAFHWIDPKAPAADIGLWLDETWSEYGEVLEWPDGGVPRDGQAAAEAIRNAFDAAGAGKRVEVGCVAGHGRTGTALACMAVLAGVPVDDAVAWVRDHYCVKAVEPPYQEPWVRWFAEHSSGVRG